MTNTGKNFVSILITFILTRVGYWFFNFDPRNNFSTYLGFAIDISIWFVLFYLILWTMNKFVKTDPAVK